MPTPLTLEDAYDLYVQTITNKEIRTSYWILDLSIGIAFNNGNYYVIALDNQRTSIDDRGYLECNAAHFVGNDFNMDESIPTDAIYLMHDMNWEWE